MIDFKYAEQVGKYCSENNLWNIPEEEARFFYELILKNKYKRILEFGTSGGYSTLWLAYAAHKNAPENAVIHTIESNKLRYEIAKTHLDKTGLNITVFLGHCPECLPEFLNQGVKYDFIFMDIVKKHYLETFKLSVDLLEKNGIIAADNINTHKKETKDFVDYISEQNNFNTQILDICNGISLTQMRINHEYD
ncbi:MAG TPA: class I SAM-dependent methyltransferase [bacterium]|nr:class I SAM-dependent methyltransferase [bacterium]HPN31989.1 class I SAM-dependent methyltransferase [bacterium]